MRPRNQGF